MAMMVSPEVAKLFQVLTGEEWPDANEDQLRVLSAEWASAAQALGGQLAPGLRAAVAAIRQNFAGEAERAFAARVSPFIEGDNYIDSAAQLFKKLSDYLLELARDVEYMKLVSIYSLIALIAEIAWAIAMSPWTGGASMAWLAARMAIVRFLLRSLLGKVLLQLVQAAVFSIAFQLLIDVAAQATQFAMGTRDKWNTKHTANAAGVGAMGAALAPFMAGLGKVLSGGLTKFLDNFFANKFGKNWTKNLPEILTDIGTEAFHETLTEALYKYATEGEFEMNPYAATSGAVSGAGNAIGEAIGDFAFGDPKDNKTGGGSNDGGGPNHTGNEAPNTAPPTGEGSNGGGLGGPPPGGGGPPPGGGGPPGGPPDGNRGVGPTDNVGGPNATTASTQPPPVSSNGGQANNSGGEQPSNGQQPPNTSTANGQPPNNSTTNQSQPNNSGADQTNNGQEPPANSGAESNGQQPPANSGTNQPPDPSGTDQTNDQQPPASSGTDQPSNGEQPPTNSGTESNGQQPPVNSGTDGQQPPANSGTENNSQQPPVDSGTDQPSNGQQPPINSGTESNGQDPPANSGTDQPTNGQQPSNNSGTDSQQPPVNSGTDRPSNDQQPPNNSGTDGQQLPANSGTESNDQQPPIDSGTDQPNTPPADSTTDQPTTGQQPPINSRTDSQQPPANLSTDQMNGQQLPNNSGTNQTNTQPPPANSGTDQPSNGQQPPSNSGTDQTNGPTHSVTDQSLNGQRPPNTSGTEQPPNSSTDELPSSGQQPPNSVIINGQPPSSSQQPPVVQSSNGQQSPNTPPTSSTTVLSSAGQQSAKGKQPSTLPPTKPQSKSVDKGKSPAVTVPKTSVPDLRTKLTAQHAAATLSIGESSTSTAETHELTTAPVHTNPAQHPQTNNEINDHNNQHQNNDQTNNQTNDDQNHNNDNEDRNKNQDQNNDDSNNENNNGQDQNPYQTQVDEANQAVEAAATARDNTASAWAAARNAHRQAQQHLTAAQRSAIDALGAVVGTEAANTRATQRVNEAQQNLTNATNNRDTLATQSDQAVDNLAAAEANSRDDGIRHWGRQTNVLETRLDAANTAITVATQNLTTAQQDATATQASVDAARTAHTDAQNAVTAAQQAVTTAHTAVQQSATHRDTANTAAAAAATTTNPPATNRPAPNSATPNPAATNQPASTPAAPNSAATNQLAPNPATPNPAATNQPASTPAAPNSAATNQPTPNPANPATTNQPAPTPATPTPSVQDLATTANNLRTTADQLATQAQDAHDHITTLTNQLNTLTTEINTLAPDNPRRQTLIDQRNSIDITDATTTATNRDTEAQEAAQNHNNAVQDLNTRLDQINTHRNTAQAAETAATTNRDTAQQAAKDAEKAKDDAKTAAAQGEIERGLTQLSGLPPDSQLTIETLGPIDALADTLAVLTGQDRPTITPDSLATAINTGKITIGDVDVTITADLHRPADTQAKPQHQQPAAVKKESVGEKTNPLSESTSSSMPVRIPLLFISPIDMAGGAMRPMVYVGGVVKRSQKFDSSTTVSSSTGTEKPNHVPTTMAITATVPGRAPVTTPVDAGLRLPSITPGRPMQSPVSPAGLTTLTPAPVTVPPAFTGVLGNAAETLHNQLLTDNQNPVQVDVNGTQVTVTPTGDASLTYVGTTGVDHTNGTSHSNSSSTTRGSDATFGTGVYGGQRGWFIGAFTDFSTGLTDGTNPANEHSSSHTSSNTELVYRVDRPMTVDNGDTTVQDTVSSTVQVPVPLARSLGLPLPPHLTGSQPVAPAPQPTYIFGKDNITSVNTPGVTEFLTDGLTAKGTAAVNAKFDTPGKSRDAIYNAMHGGEQVVWTDGGRTHVVDVHARPAPPTSTAPSGQTSASAEDKNADQFRRTYDSKRTARLGVGGAFLPTFTDTPNPNAPKATPADGNPNPYQGGPTTFGGAPRAAITGTWENGYGNKSGYTGKDGRASKYDGDLRDFTGPLEFVVVHRSTKTPNWAQRFFLGDRMLFGPDATNRVTEPTQAELDQAFTNNQPSQHIRTGRVDDAIEVSTPADKLPWATQPLPESQMTPGVYLGDAPARPDGVVPITRTSLGDYTNVEHVRVTPNTTEGVYIALAKRVEPAANAPEHTGPHTRIPPKGSGNWSSWGQRTFTETRQGPDGQQNTTYTYKNSELTRPGTTSGDAVRDFVGRVGSRGTASQGIGGQPNATGKMIQPGRLTDFNGDLKATSEYSSPRVVDVRPEGTLKRNQAGDHIAGSTKSSGLGIDGEVSVGIAPKRESGTGALLRAVFGGGWKSGNSHAVDLTSGGKQTYEYKGPTAFVAMDVRYTYEADLNLRNVFKTSGFDDVRVTVDEPDGVLVEMPVAHAIDLFTMAQLPVPPELTAVLPDAPATVDNPAQTLLTPNGEYASHSDTTVIRANLNDSDGARGQIGDKLTELGVTSDKWRNQIFGQVDKLLNTPTGHVWLKDVLVGDQGVGGVISVPNSGVAYEDVVDIRVTATPAVRPAQQPSTRPLVPGKQSNADYVSSSVQDKKSSTWNVAGAVEVGVNHREVPSVPPGTPDANGVVQQAPPNAGASSGSLTPQVFGGSKSWKTDEVLPTSVSDKVNTQVDTDKVGRTGHEVDYHLTISRRRSPMPAIDAPLLGVPKHINRDKLGGDPIVLEGSVDLVSPSKDASPPLAKPANPPTFEVLRTRPDQTPMFTPTDGWRVEAAGTDTIAAIHDGVYSQLSDHQLPFGPATQEQVQNSAAQTSEYTRPGSNSEYVLHTRTTGSAIHNGSNAIFTGDSYHVENTIGRKHTLYDSLFDLTVTADFHQDSFRFVAALPADTTMNLSQDQETGRPAGKSSTVSTSFGPSLPWSAGNTYGSGGPGPTTVSSGPPANTTISQDVTTASSSKTAETNGVKHSGRSYVFLANADIYTEANRHGSNWTQGALTSTWDGIRGHEHHADSVMKIGSRDDLHVRVWENTALDKGLLTVADVWSHGGKQPGEGFTITRMGDGAVLHRTGEDVPEVVAPPDGAPRGRNLQVAPNVTLGEVKDFVSSLPKDMRPTTYTVDESAPFGVADIRDEVADLPEPPPADTATEEPTTENAVSAATTDDVTTPTESRVVPEPNDKSVVSLNGESSVVPEPINKSVVSSNDKTSVVAEPSNDSMVESGVVPESVGKSVAASNVEIDLAVESKDTATPPVESNHGTRSVIETVPQLNQNPPPTDSLGGRKKQTTTTSTGEGSSSQNPTPRSTGPIRTHQQTAAWFSDALRSVGLTPFLSGGAALGFQDGSRPINDLDFRITMSDAEFRTFGENNGRELLTFLNDVVVKDLQREYRNQRANDPTVPSGGVVQEFFGLGGTEGSRTIGSPNILGHEVSVSVVAGDKPNTIPMDLDGSGRQVDLLAPHDLRADKLRTMISRTKTGDESVKKVAQDLFDFLDAMDLIDGRTEPAAFKDQTADHVDQSVRDRFSQYRDGNLDGMQLHHLNETDLFDLMQARAVLTARAHVQHGARRDALDAMFKTAALRGGPDLALRLTHRLEALAALPVAPHSATELRPWMKTWNDPESFGPPPESRSRGRQQWRDGEDGLPPTEADTVPPPPAVRDLMNIHADDIVANVRATVPTSTPEIEQVVRVLAFSGGFRDLTDFSSNQQTLHAFGLTKPAFVRAFKTLRDAGLVTPSDAGLSLTKNGWRLVPTSGPQRVFGLDGQPIPPPSPSRPSTPVEIIDMATEATTNLAAETSQVRRGLSDRASRVLFESGWRSSFPSRSYRQAIAIISDALLNGGDGPTVRDMATTLADRWHDIIHSAGRPTGHTDSLAGTTAPVESQPEAPTPDVAPEPRPGKRSREEFEADDGPVTVPEPPSARPVPERLVPAAPEDTEALLEVVPPGTRFPDPATFVELINGARSDEGRDVNCVDAALAFHATYHGDPRVAGSAANGVPRSAGTAAGEELGYAPELFSRGEAGLAEIVERVRRGGHGADAVVFGFPRQGQGHAWNIVNHHGAVSIVDAQDGVVLPATTNPVPGLDRIYAIPLDADGTFITDDATPPTLPTDADPYAVAEYEHAVQVHDLRAAAAAGVEIPLAEGKLVPSLGGLRLIGATVAAEYAAALAGLTGRDVIALVIGPDAEYPEFLRFTPGGRPLPV